MYYLLSRSWRCQDLFFKTKTKTTFLVLDLVQTKMQSLKTTSPASSMWNVLDNHKAITFSFPVLRTSVRKFMNNDCIAIHRQLQFPIRMMCFSVSKILHRKKKKFLCLLIFWAIKEWCTVWHCSLKLSEKVILYWSDNSVIKQMRCSYFVLCAMHKTLLKVHWQILLQCWVALLYTITLYDLKLCHKSLCK